MTGYPWSQGDLLLANDLNAAIANSVALGGGMLPLTGGTMTGPLFYTATGGTTPRSAQNRAAVVANALDFGADPTGLADSTAAIAAAIATGYNVYIPRGNYIVRNQLTTQATGQEIYGDGRLTTLLIDQTFNASATCVISLVGREQFSPTIRDLTIMFAQPSDQNSRANFLTLAAGGTSGTGGTGIMYPPAIALTNTNRFKLRNLKIVRAWVGITNVGSNTIGGFFIRDIEMCAFSVGLSLDNVLDFPHVMGYHMWAFDLSTALQQGVWWDGNTFAIRLGVNNDFGGLNGSDICCYDSRFQINGANSFVSISGLYMDGNNATLEVANGNQIQIINGYFSGGPTNANPSTAQCNVTGGNVFLSNMYFQSGGGKQAIFMSGGKLWIQGGEVSDAANNFSAMVQTGGRSYINGVSWAVTDSAAWTVPVINASGGLLHFHSNTFVNPSAGDVGGLVITTDNALNSVGGNFWNGWGFTPPGPLGDYGFNSANANWGTQLVMGKTGQGGRIDFRRGSDGGATAWIGMLTANSTTHLNIANLSGSSNIILNPTGASVFQIGGTEYGRVDTNGLGLSKTVVGAAPGATFAKLAFVTGTTAGTGKLVAYCGTSATPVTIMDNIGAGF